MDSHWLAAIVACVSPALVICQNNQYIRRRCDQGAGECCKKQPHREINSLHSAALGSASIRPSAAGHASAARASAAAAGGGR